MVKKADIATTGEDSTSWMQKKATADAEGTALQVPVDELFSWVNSMSAMDERQQRKSLLSQLRTKPFRTKQGRKRERTYALQMQKGGRSRQPKCSRISLIAAVWKFHSEEDDASSIAVAAAPSMTIS